MRTTTTTQMDGSSGQEEELAPPCRTGDVLADKYVIERLIGQGGMGYVYSARTRRGNTRVAIKLLHPRLSRDDEKTQRFLREARATARLSSEHIVRVLDVGKREQDGLPYMVMEYLEGEDLGEWLERLGPFPVDLAVHYVMQACQALSLAHAAGIVHRDIKPSNLLLVRQAGGDARLKLLDFGISKAADPDGSGRGAITQTSAVFGSPTYMSPEQVRSAKNVDSRSDVWALGVVLFELLSGETPFVGETPGAILAAIVADPPRDLRALRPELPQKLLDIVAHCLTKSRDQRLASVDELAQRLTPFLNESSDSQHSINLAGAARRTVRMESPLHRHPVGLEDAEPPLGRTLRMPSPLGQAGEDPWGGASANTALTYARSAGRRGDYRTLAIVACALFATVLTALVVVLRTHAADLEDGSVTAAPATPLVIYSTVPCVAPSVPAAPPPSPSVPRRH